MLRVARSVQTAIQGRRSQDAHAVRWTLAPDGSSGWREVSVELLPGTAGGPSAGSFAFAVNLHGDAVGVGSGYTAGGIPVIWPVAGGLQELPTAAGGGEGRPVDINRDGWIVGAVYDGANKCDRAAIWRLR
jgi:hypothetical protein